MPPPVRQATVLWIATASVVGLAGVQALRWEDNPGVIAVSVLVTAQIALILSYLLVQQRRGKGPGESSVAAFLGLAAAVVLTVATPALGSKPKGPPPEKILVRLPLPDSFPEEVAPTTPRPQRLPAVMPVPAKPEAPPEPEVAPPEDPPAPPVETENISERPALEVYRRLMEEPPWPRLRQDTEEVHELLRRGLPSRREPLALPPMHAGASLFLGHVRGELGLVGGGRLLEGPLDELLGSQTFEPAVELLAEFPLAPRHVLAVSFIGLRSSEIGFADADTAIGAVVAPAGTPYEFEMQWAHVFVGFGHRFVGYTRESPLDFSLRAGVMIDHLSAEARASDLSAHVDSDQQGWAAPALGLSVGWWDLGRSGMLVEIHQSIPVNIGGQTLAVSDVRLLVQHDLSDSISFQFGYRWVFAAFRTFEHPVKYSHEETVSELAAGGPLAGLDVRF